MKIKQWDRKLCLKKGFYGIFVLMLVLEAALLGRNVSKTEDNIVTSENAMVDGEIQEGTEENGGNAERGDAQEDTPHSEPSPKIALTFDDGPSIYTEELLDGLKERNVKVTFFVIGESAEIYPELVTREVQEGHLVGNHTYHHVDITKLSVRVAREEIEKTNHILESLTQKKTEYVRPPFGVWEAELEDLEMMLVMWTIDPLDWTTKNTDEIVNKVVTQAEENDIILLHDCYKSSVQAALRIVDILQSEGFEFVTVDQLFIE